MIVSCAEHLIVLIALPPSLDNADDPLLQGRKGGSHSSKSVQVARDLVRSNCFLLQFQKDVRSRMYIKTCT